SGSAREEYAPAARPRSPSVVTLREPCATSWSRSTRLGWSQAHGDPGKALRRTSSPGSNRMPSVIHACGHRTYSWNEDTKSSARPSQRSVAAIFVGSLLWRRDNIPGAAYWSLSIFMAFPFAIFLLQETKAMNSGNVSAGNEGFTTTRAGAL